MAFCENIHLHWAKYAICLKVDYFNFMIQALIKWAFN